MIPQTVHSGKDNIFHTNLPNSAFDYAISSNLHEQEDHCESHKLMVSTDKDVTLRLRDHKFELPAESACLIPCGLEHTLLTTTTSVVHYIYFKAALPITSFRSVSLSSLTKELIHEIYKENKSEASKRLLCNCLYDQLANMLWENNQPINTLSKPLQRACEIIYNKSEVDLSIADLATRVGVSGRTLRRLANAQLNYSLAEFRTRCRIHEACLLLQSDIPISHISGEVGYESESAFYNSFKLVVGTTPLQFRKNGITEVTHQR